MCREVVWKGGGAGFEPMTCSVEVLRFRASHQCCTEAMSEVGCNSSPILLGKLLDITKLLCIECKFSDLGTTVILGRLEHLYCIRARCCAVRDVYGCTCTNIMYRSYCYMYIT